MPQRALELKVGFFLLLGLGVVATMIIVFGRFQESFKATNTITVEFTNAQGLLKGTTVTLAGSPIGRVKNAPHPINNGTAVAVELRLDREVVIRKGSRFSIVDVGMLGDKAVDIQPDRTKSPEELEKVEPLVDGDHVKGASVGGLSELSSQLNELTTSAKPTIAQINEVVAHLKSVSAKIDEEVMTPDTTQDLKESLKKLRSILTRVDALMAQAQAGKGPLAKILNDPKMADDLASFISNLRRKGVLFYSDLATHEKEEKK